jgi:multisubunit Na+/H+ antiporter MnhC subunit
VAEIAVVLFLQLMDIRDLTQTLWMTHVMIGLAVLYFIYTICNKFYHHTTTHALWI